MHDVIAPIGSPLIGAMQFSKPDQHECAVVTYSAVPRRPNWEFCPDGICG